MVSTQPSDVRNAPDAAPARDALSPPGYLRGDAYTATEQTPPVSRLSAEQEWSEAVLEVERARQAYMERLRSAETDDPAIGRLWLRLWRAERKRDRLIRSQV